MGTEPYVPSRFWEDRYEKFDITRSGHRDLPFIYNEWLYRFKKKKVREALRRLRIAPKSSDVLELGCGTGVYVDMWRDLAAKSIVGFDISSVPVEKLKAKYPEHGFFQEDLTDATMADRHAAGSFDVVTAFDVLYHIIEDGPYLKALGNINRLCRAGAHFMITDLFVHGPESVRGYMKFRSLANVTAMLAKAGFEIVERRPVFFSMIQASDAPVASAARYDFFWSKVQPFIQSRPALMGRALYALDALVTPWLSEGPALELLVCKKVRAAAPEAV